MAEADFKPDEPSSWTWTGLNEWLRGLDDLGQLRQAIEVGRRGGAPLTYLRRINARYRRVLLASEAAKFERTLKGR